MNVLIFSASVNSYYSLIQNDYHAILSEEELSKSLRFIKKKDKERFISAKYLLRIVLSKFLFLAPSQIKFNFIANRKPCINGIEFNMTHSEDYILIAISSIPVGIDIEFINRNFGYEPMLAHNFNADEIAFVNMGEDQFLNFYTLWTRKEAILKASGEGLTNELSAVSCLNSEIFRKQTHYKLISFKFDCDYLVSLAINCREENITYSICDALTLT